MPFKTKKRVNIANQTDQLMLFLEEKSKIATSPLQIRPLCREFKEKNGSNKTENCLKMRIERIRLKIHEMNEIDIETRIRMMFCLSAPVDSNFLEKMKDCGYVNLDEFDRITEFKTETMRLSGTHPKHSKIIPERNQKMLEFLAEITKTTSYPISDTSFVKGFKFRGQSRSQQYLIERYVAMKKDIYKAEEFDKTTKIRMLFVSGAVIPGYVLEELRIDAHVELDEKGRIATFVSNDGSMDLRRELMKTPRKRGGGRIPWRPSPAKSLKRPMRAEENPENPKKSKFQSPEEPEDAPEVRIKEEILETPREKSRIPSPNEPEDTPTEGIIKKEILETIEKVEINSSETRELSIPREKGANSKNYLKMLRYLIISTGSPKLEELQLEIEKKINEIEENNKIPIADIEISLRTMLLSIQRAGKPEESPEEKASLHAILMVILSYLHSLEIMELISIEKEIDKLIRESGEKIIPISILRQVLGTVLIMIRF